jgi:hypothetical protein
MGDYGRSRLDLDDEDRLPWLEPAIEEDEGDGGLSPIKLLSFIIVALILLGAIIGGIWWLQNRGAQVDAGEGTLIAAPTESYKIAANEADAKTFEGAGDASFAASEGVLRDSRIDPSRVPEAPMTQTTPPAEKAKAPAATRPSARVSAPVTDETRPKAPVPVAKPSSTGAMIQLGAYGSESGAQAAWGKLSKRFAYLAPLAMAVQPVEIGGSTVYRLRALAGGQSATLCGKLKVAGESCLVVN